MSIDFGRLVLAPAMGVFSQPVVINPIVSQPSGTTYSCRAIWSNKPLDIALENGSYISTNQPMIGIRLADFPVAPRQDDQATVSNVLYDIIDVKIDGQGGADLWLRRAG